MLHYEKEIEECESYDIIVAGGGVAGVSAAVSAARLGKKVLLIEKSLKLGGLATLGLINLFVPMCNGRGKQIIFGMAEELLRLSIKYGYDTLPTDFENGFIPKDKLEQYKMDGKEPPRYMSKFSAEIFALTLTELCKNEGVTVLFDCMVTDAVSDENGKNRLKGVIVQSKSGLLYYTAEIFIDTTGDSDIMAKAGIPTVNRGNFHTYLGFKISLESCERASKFNNIDLAVSNVAGGCATLYGTGQPDDVKPYDGTDYNEINRYINDNQIEMLEKIKKDDRLLRNIVTLPGMPQFRTTRRIGGDYVLKENDTYRHFEDSVGAICDFDRRDYLFEIPYRTLVNKKYPNIITAGRSAAGDGYAWDVLRVIPPAIISGQAAGIAAVHAIDENKPIAGIDIKSLQNELIKQNVIIHFDDADIPEISFDIHEGNDS